MIHSILDRCIPALPKIHPIGSWKTCYQANPLSWDKKRRIKRFQKSSHTFTALWHNSLLLCVQPKEEVSECAYTQGFYEPNQFSAIKQILKEGDAFIDIGAHIGLYSIYAAKRIGSTGHVYSFEPSIRERMRLEKHLQLNHLRNITVYPSAVCDQSSQAEIKVAEYPHSGHNTLGSFAYDTTQEKSRHNIETQSLDNWASQNQIQKIDLIKIDAEGSEEKILRGAQKILSQTRPVLMIEITSLSLKHQNSSIENIWNLILDSDYILMAYDSTSGLPYRVMKHPGIEHTDFIAIPKEKINQFKFQ